MKTDEDREEDFIQLFHSILSRINEKRNKDEQINFFDREVGEAVQDYVKTYLDYIVYGGD